METSHHKQESGRHIGTVDSVSPDKIEVLLDFETSDSVDLKTGNPRTLPRINGYLLVRADNAFLVGQIESLTVARSLSPKHREMSDSDSAALPHPSHRLRINPLGTLRLSEPQHDNGDGLYEFSRGADTFPPIGAEVLLPTEKQLCAVVESAERQVNIGTNPLADDVGVYINPDRLFGRHLAVLGNTGSGKSCSIAGLIRWCFESAKNENRQPPNARFIILDPSGEYSRAFGGEGDIPAKILKVDDDKHPLNVPLWLWNSEEWCAFTQASAGVQRPSLRTALLEVKRDEENASVYADENTPSFFRGDSLLANLVAKENRYLDSLISRIKTLLSNSQMKSVVDREERISLQQWLEDYLGRGDLNDAHASQISIVDLSLVPTDVVHIVTSVIARMIFETLQRYMKKHGKSLPTVLVMEEAHSFIKHRKDDGAIESAANICCQTFERIAKEGRKFGLGLVLSSQRPSELSATVLSQCNTFLVHRINNDFDRESVRRLVPDNLRGLFRELPSLPSQRAILLGWAAELPVLVKIKNLEEKHRPKSEDPKFWDVWTGAEKHPIGWNEIANEWQGY